MKNRGMNLKEHITTERFYYYFVITLAALMPAAELITELIGLPFITQPVILAAYGCVGFLSAICFFMKRTDAEIITLHPSDIFFALLIFFAVISLVFSKDMIISVTGFDYDEWIVHFLAYYSLMFAGTMITDTKLRKNALYVFAAVGALNGVIAFFQSFDIWFFDGYFAPQPGIAFSLTQNSNFYAGISIIFAAVSAGLFIFSDKKGFKKYGWLALYTLCFYGSIASQTRISWLGNLAVMFFYGISFIVMKKKKYDPAKLKRFAAGFGLTLCAAAILLVYFAVFTDTLKGGLMETLDDLSGQDFAKFGSRRGYIWMFGLESVPQNWLTGVGLDNYSYAFFNNPKWEPGMYFQDKGHNEYIHTLVTQGVFAAVNYIAMLVYACTIGVKTVINTNDEENRIVTWIFLGMFAGYAAQALVNSSVINTAFYFWIVVGMTMPRTAQKPITLRTKQFKK